MTERAVIAVIMCICNHMNTKEAKLACINTYANCAIYGDGKSRDSQYKSQQDFKHTCDFHPKTNMCVEKFGADY